jgi:phospholipid N-methyltransferase
MMNINQSKSLTGDRFSFFLKFIKSPQTIGSITPSSKYLTSKMLEEVPWHRINSLIELGAGTGVFTKHICNNIRNNCKVIIFEKDRQMYENLKKTYTGCHFSRDAEHIDKVLEDLGLAQTDCIISGLPFACFSPEQREKILGEIVASLKDGGDFIAFQYSLQMKKLLVKSFRNVKISVVPFNIPPAFVYHCTK